MGSLFRGDGVEMFLTGKVKNAVGGDGRAMGEVVQAGVSSEEPFLATGGKHHDGPIGDLHVDPAVGDQG